MVNPTTKNKVLLTVDEIDLPLQFVISELPVNQRVNFISFQYGGLNISAHNNLKKFCVFEPTGSQVGMFLGMPIDINKELIIQEDIYHSKNIAAEDVPLFLENYAGSFVFIYISSGRRRLYLDANGTMSAVYDTLSKISSSTAALLFDKKCYFERLRRKQFYQLDIINMGWFPSGLTAHEGVNRLLCNHYLDLNTWESFRFWPLNKIEYSEDPESEIISISKETTKTMTAMCNSKHILQSLTAGYETRFLLSCAKSLIDKISFFIVLSNKMDVDIARKLSDDFGLHLTEFPIVEANTKQQQEWLYRAGHGVGGMNLITHPSIQKIQPGTILSIGLGGEVGRGFFWKKKDNIFDNVTAELLSSRFGMPYDELVVDKTCEWLTGLPKGLDFFTIMDLAYLELRMSAWAFAQSYAQDSICVHISPMITYRNYKSMFRIHPNVKRDGYILKQAILKNWPELLKYPINRYGGWRDVLALVNKLSNPKRVFSKVRKMLSN